MQGENIQNITQHESNKVHKKQFKYLIDTMQLYHFTDEQWNNLEATLKDNRDGFTDDQLKMVNYLLPENRLNDEQLRFFCGYA